MSVNMQTWYSRIALVNMKNQAGSGGCIQDVFLRLNSENLHKLQNEEHQGVADPCDDPTAAKPVSGAWRKRTAPLRAEEIAPQEPCEGAARSDAVLKLPERNTGM